MLVDGKALQEAGCTGSESYPDAENERHPKAVALRLLGDEKTLWKKYAAIALAVRMDLLEKCCTKGFAPFAKEVRDNLGPLVTGTTARPRRN